jgi:dnd system-associated protein 4
MSKFKEKWRFQFPEHASYEAEDKKIYENFKSNKSSFFYRLEYTQIFLAAMALGYHKKERKPLNKRSRSIPTNVFNPYERWMIISLAVEEERDVSILKNEAKILNIAEEYANGGIKYLNSIQDDDILANPIESFEKELRKQLDQL